MKFLLVIAIIAVLLLAAVAIYRLVRKLKSTKPISTQDRIVASVTDSLAQQRANRSVRPSTTRTAPVVEYRKSIKPAASKPVKSKNDDVDFGYYEEPSYFSQSNYSEPASYVEPTRYESPSTTSYESPSSSPSSSYDSGSSSSSSGSSDY